MANNGLMVEFRRGQCRRVWEGGRKHFTFEMGAEYFLVWEILLYSVEKGEWVKPLKDFYLVVRSPGRALDEDGRTRTSIAIDMNHRER